MTGLLHRKGLHAYTHATLVSPVHLKEDLALTRKRGYSFDDESTPWACAHCGLYLWTSIANPFAAISSPGPISRMTDDRVTELGCAGIKAAQE